MTVIKAPAIAQVKLASAEGFIGDTERRTAAYFWVGEDSSTGSTQK